MPEKTPYQLSLFTAAAGCVGFCLWRLWEWYRTRSFGLKDIRGPDTEPLSSRPFSHAPPHPVTQVLIHELSFLFFSTGNVDKARQSEAGEMDFLWHEQFGGIMRLKGPFGVRFFGVILHLPGILTRTRRRARACAIVGGPVVGVGYQGLAPHPQWIQLREGALPKGNRAVVQRSRSYVGER